MNNTENYNTYKWIHRFALLTAITALGLIVAGALVTSTDSGDAVPDWPLSYGTLTPPMIGGILYEHTHRLIAGLTGVLVAVLAIWLWRKMPHRSVRWVGIAALVGVIVQGTLGGLRVLVVSTETVQDVALTIFGTMSIETIRIAIAITHGCLAQLIICLLFVIVAATSPKWMQFFDKSNGRINDSRFQWLSLALMGTVFLQLLLGLIVRHSGAGLVIPDFPLAFGQLLPPLSNLPIDPNAPFPISVEELRLKVLVHFAHRLMAFIVFGLTIFLFLKYRQNKYFGKMLYVLLSLVFFQIILGALNIWTRQSVFSTVPHVLGGALIFALNSVLLVWSWRFRVASITGEEIREKVLAYVELTKPRLTLLVVCAALTGYVVAATEGIVVMSLISSLFGIGLASSGALALNQFMEREFDAKMNRTKNRPLPGGRLQPQQALTFGISLCISSVIFLTLVVNMLTGILVALIILSYLFAYTPLKRISAMNTVVGAIPGALPIVCGWTAARNSLDPESFILFGILFLWQFPHFLSIALLYRRDYRLAGFKMLPVMDNGVHRTHLHIVATCIALLFISILPTMWGLTGTIYLLIAVLAGSVFLSYGVCVAIYKANKFARRLMLASFVYPLFLWGFMIADKIRI